MIYNASLEIKQGVLNFLGLCPLTVPLMANYPLFLKMLRLEKSPMNLYKFMNFVFSSFLLH